MLGRQAYAVQPRFGRVYAKSLRDAGVDLLADQMVQEDGYSETLFRSLGLGEIEAMDMSAFEGAQHVHDLNVPVSEEYHEAFDFIFDGGTLEHVFNAPQAMMNVFHMLKPGGRFLSFNGLNGWVGHGMWQFTPEMVWTFWRHHAQCNVLTCAAIAKRSSDWRLDFPDAAEKGVRLRLKNKIPEGRIYLLCEIEKPDGAALADGSVLQSDYQVKWQSHETLAGEVA